MKTRWYKDVVFYQIYPRSFCDSKSDGIGDIKGIISKLDYLKELGIGGIWLSPIYKSPNFDMGYDISDYYKVSKDYGTMEDFDLLIKELKKKDIKIIIDLVVNHTSDEHNWFIESKKSIDNPYRNYYIWKKGKGKDGLKPPNNWTSRFLGPAWTYDGNTKEWYLHLFTDKQPDLNWDNIKVREEIKDICNYWFEKGVNGFRCDVITYIVKNQTFENGKYKPLIVGDEHFVMYGKWHEYIKYLHKESWSKYDSYIIAEGMGAKYKDVLDATNELNKEFDSFITFDHMSIDFIKGLIPRKKLNLIKLKISYNKWQQLPKENWQTLYNENHDQPRSVSRYIKNTEYHDEGAKMLFTTEVFLKGTPYIFQGQEIGMTNYPLKMEDYNDIFSQMVFKKSSKTLIGRTLFKKYMSSYARENARTSMQWNDSAFAGFSSSKVWYRVNPNKDRINVDKQQKNLSSILLYYKSLIALRTNNEVIKFGEYKDLLPTHKMLYVYTRSYKNKTYLVCSNFFDKEVKMDLSKVFDKKIGFVILSNYEVAGERNINDILKPYETRVFYFK